MPGKEKPLSWAWLGRGEKLRGALFERDCIKDNTVIFGRQVLG